MLSDRQPAPITDSETSPLEILTTIWAGKYQILLAALVCLAIGLFSVLRTEPLYRAQGLLQLEPKSGSLSLPEGMQELLGGARSASPVLTEIEIMKSRMVIGDAAQVLKLETFAIPRPLPVLGVLPVRLRLADPDIALLKPYRWGNEAISLGELTVPERWVGQSLVLRITGPGVFDLVLPDAQVLSGRVGVALRSSDDQLSVLVNNLTGPTGREFLIGKRSLASTIRAVQRRFSVSEVSRGSAILSVSYTDTNPRRAENVVDAIAASYVAQNVSRSAAQVENSLKFIETQLPIAQAAVTEAQDRLNDYRQAQSSVDVDYETQVLLERATQIESELNKLALEEETLKSRYTINHPVYQALLQNRAALQAQLSEVQSTAINLPETQKEIFNLTRNLEVAQEIYVQLLNRGQELRVVRASTVGSVRVIDTAFSDDLPIAPQTSRALALALAIGLTLGVGFVLLMSLLRKGIRGAQEIERLGLPVFATVSHSEQAASNRSRRGTLPILALVAPDDIVVEAIRSLRTALHFGMLDAKTNTVLLTSAAPEAGKSFTAINLAAVAAQAGQRVCLIDGDMRKGYLRRYIGSEKGAPGLSELLAGETILDKVLVPGPVDGLSVIVSGRYPPNPSELLMRGTFPALLAELDQKFDLIIIDSPPTLAVTDPVVIARHVGATILVTRHLRTMAGEIAAVQRSFETANTRLTGAILNGYKAEHGGQYGGQNYSYNYRYRYKADSS